MSLRRGAEAYLVRADETNDGTYIKKGGGMTALFPDRAYRVRGPERAETAVSRETGDKKAGKNTGAQGAPSEKKSAQADALC